MFLYGNTCADIFIGENRIFRPFWQGHNSSNDEGRERHKKAKEAQRGRNGEGMEREQREREGKRERERMS